MKYRDFKIFINSIIPNSEKTAESWLEWAKELERMDSSDGELPKGEYKTAEDFLNEFVNHIQKAHEKYGADVAQQLISLADIPACAFPWEMDRAAEHLANGGNINDIPQMERDGTLEEYTSANPTPNTESKSPKPMLSEKRVREILSNALNYLAEMQKSSQLYSTLHDSLGMTNEEISNEGFDLENYYDEDKTEPNSKLEQGLAKRTIMDEKFQVVTIFNKPVLFTCDRIDRTKVPDNLFCYDIRHDDDCRGDMAEVKDHVMINHWGTVICKEPFGTQEYNGRIFTTKEGLIIDDGDYNYLNEDITISEYLDRYDELISEYCSISEISDEDEEDEI